MEQRANRQTCVVRDTAGSRIFSAGDIGQAHTTAHRMLDGGRLSVGRRMLGEWLDGRVDSGSRWVHLQWHMAVFELELGDWDESLHRFERHILPAATSSDSALTDAPGLLWRLCIAARGHAELPWEALRETALVNLHRHTDPYVELHNLLALAGADDAESIEQWLAARRPAHCTDSANNIAEIKHIQHFALFFIHAALVTEQLNTATGIL